MTTTQHLLFLGATLLTLMAPALTLPCLGAWALMAWLGRTIDAAPAVVAVEGKAGGCGCTMAMILFVGVGALLLVLVGGAVLEGRI